MLCKVDTPNFASKLTPLHLDVHNFHTPTPNGTSLSFLESQCQGEHTSKFL